MVHNRTIDPRRTRVCYGVNVDQDSCVIASAHDLEDAFGFSCTLVVDSHPNSSNGCF